MPEDDGAAGGPAEDRGTDAGAKEDGGPAEDRGMDAEGSEDPELTHTGDAGDVEMVDVGDKPDSRRRAVARGEIHLRPETVAAVRENDVAKGDVLATARVGAVQAVKHTWETIPLCHQIPVTNVETDFALGEDRIELTVAVETTGKTGCEMEALEGVTTGLNVVWDMVKSAEKDGDAGYPETRIGGIEVLSKDKRPPG